MLFRLFSLLFSVILLWFCLFAQLGTNIPLFRLRKFWCTFVCPTCLNLQKFRELSSNHYKQWSASFTFPEELSAAPLSTGRQHEKQMDQVIYKRDFSSSLVTLSLVQGPYLTQMDGDDRRLLLYSSLSTTRLMVVGAIKWGKGREIERERQNRSAATSVLQCYKLRDIRRYDMAIAGGCSAVWIINGRTLGAFYGAILLIVGNRQW